MQSPPSCFEDLGHGITCIDANYVQDGLACFYLLEEDGECAIIETGTSHSLDNLERTMAAKGLASEQVRYVIPTHVHLDHAGGAGAMMARFPQAQLLVHPRGARHLVDPARLIESSIAVYGEAEFRALYGEIVSIPAQRVIEAADGYTVTLGQRTLELRHTEGHARHHFCLWDERSLSWFTGDMFGVSYPWFRFGESDYVLPSTTPTQFDPVSFHASLGLLDSYAPQQMLLTHYGSLPYSAALLQMLHRQVDGYCQLASEHPDVDLGALLVDYCADLAATLPGAPAVEVLREQLDFDSSLNAQGLHVWLQREAATV